MRKITLVLMFWLVLLAFAQAQQSPMINDEFYAADQSVFILPTAYTMPAGTHAFTDFMIVLMQYSYSVTDRMHVSAGMVFPFEKNMLKTFSFGGKYRYLSSGNLDSSAWATLTPDPMTMTVGNVLSWGNPNRSLHLAGAGLFNLKEGEGNFFFGVGGISQLSGRINLMGEVVLIPSDFEDGAVTISSEYEAIGIVGLRFKGQKISWDLGAARMLTEDMGDILAIPFLKATFLF